MAHGALTALRTRHDHFGEQEVEGANDVHQERNCDITVFFDNVEFDGVRGAEICQENEPDDKLNVVTDVHDEPWNR